MYPNDARLRNMTYAITIHYDVDVEYFIHDDDKTSEVERKQTFDKPHATKTFEKIYLGRFPIMLMSDQCILKGLTPAARFELGECKNDYGGYFIIDGKEKCIVSQEKFADNMLYVKDKVDDVFSHSADIRSVSEDASKPVRTLSIRVVKPSTKYTNNQIVVNIPNVRMPVPLFILMRALGVESDKDIIKYCLIDLKKY
jgi:DNA-directed RNA polymerase II subunit RPB2